MVCKINSSINGPEGPGHKRRALQIVSQFKCIPGGEQRNSVVVLKQTDVSDELGTFHLQSHSLSRQEWQERTSLPSQCAKGAFQDKAWDWCRRTIKCLKNKYHYWWQLSKRTEKNKIRYNLFWQDRMFESSPTKSAQFTSCNTVCMIAPSQGKELGLKSRLSCNHHRAVALSRFGVRSASLSTAAQVPDAHE